MIIMTCRNYYFTFEMNNKRILYSKDDVAAVSIAENYHKSIGLNPPSGIILTSLIVKYII